MDCPPCRVTLLGVTMYRGAEGRNENSTDAVSGFVMHRLVVYAWFRRTSRNVRAPGSMTNIFAY